MATMKLSYVLFIGFILHLVFLMSIFDIYFKTPIVRGITSNHNPVPGPAKRLVFIVADGLRADSFYSNAKDTTPFLRSKLESDGSWGVSHTRVPTESRPGIVALAAGIYEDPSAVFKGWKENPVEFDSLFNQSRYTWAWGSPDIVHMFKQEHVETMSYHPDDEDFSGKDSSWKLDEWVFNHVQFFFERAKNDSTLTDLLYKDKLVFFLHLLGLDTAGHTIKPHSKNYLENLQVVDRGVRDIEDLFENFYNDRKTSYVFTADHGMTNWGSHGAGSRDETEVPLLAWGPGVKEPRPAVLSDPKSPPEWQLSHLKRKDVKQADIVVLLASLIGCSIPVNSVGSLPHFYLDLPPESIADLMILNAQQLLNQALRKKDLVLRGPLSWYLHPYANVILKKEKLPLAHIQMLKKDYASAVTTAEELIGNCLEALHYYHTLYQQPLLFFVSLSFIGWIAILFCQLSNFRIDPSGSKRNCLFVFSGFVVFAVIQVQELEYQFYIYCLLPILLWWCVFATVDSWGSVLRSRSQVVKFFAAGAVMLLFIEIMVVAFFQRWVLSLGMLIISIWPLCRADLLNRLSPSLIFMWLFSCASVAFFPLLPVIGSESSLALVIFSGILWIAAITASIYIMYGALEKIKILYQLSPLVAALAVVYCVTISVESGNGLPPPFQFLSWSLLCSPIFVLTTEDRTIPRRLIKLHALILPPYILMSVRHEGLFLLALCFHLNCWLLIESKINGIELSQLKRVEFPHPGKRETIKRSLTIEDFRRASLFVFYIFFSFFGTGNIASLNSFEIVWVRCFLSVFSPFSMMALILVKMLIPFVIVSSIFRAINTTIKAPITFMFIAVLIVCDLMGVHFLHFVTNEGSWLDIGSSISHYVIVQVTVLALVLLYSLASVLTGTHLHSPLEHVSGILLQGRHEPDKRHV